MNSTKLLIMVVFVLFSLKTKSQIEAGVDKLFSMMHDYHANYFDVILYGDQLFSENPSLALLEDDIFQEYSRWKEFWGSRVSYVNSPGSIKKVCEAYSRFALHPPSNITGLCNYQLQQICSSSSVYLANWSPYNVPII